jgi:hypothetical protein
MLAILTPVLVLLVHEGLHGVGFLVFGGRPKFGAGIKGGAPYLFATYPGRRFTWGRTLGIGVQKLVGGPGFEPGTSRSRTDVVPCPRVSRRVLLSMYAVNGTLHPRCTAYENQDGAAALKVLPQRKSRALVEPGSFRCTPQDHLVLR